MVKAKDTGLTLASSTYEAIRQDIMEGHIPPGEKLQFDALRERYDVGISPIREALSRLHSDGWVEREEQRGYRVTAISRDELLDVVRTRTLIEGVGGSCAAGQTPVYRIFRGQARFPDNPNHRFTTELAIYNSFVALGWDGEGVKFCVPN